MEKEVKALAQREKEEIDAKRVLRGKKPFDKVEWMDQSSQNFSVGCMLIVCGLVFALLSSLHLTSLNDERFFLFYGFVSIIGSGFSFMRYIKYKRITQLVWGC